MKNITLVLAFGVTLLLSALTLADIDVDVAEAKTGIPLEEFVQLPLEQRIKICASLVNAEAIGECVTVRKPTNKPTAHLSEERIKMEIFRCEKEMKTTDIQQLVACAREKLNAGTKQDRPVVTEAQIKRAEEYCAQHYSAANEFGSCVSGILRHIDHMGDTDQY